MSYDPRTIALHAELLHPPMQLRADVAQGIHNSLYRRPEIAYQNFQVGPDGIHLSNPAQTPGMVSQASFHPDRLIFREELRGITVEDFATRVVNAAVVAYESLGIGSSVAQQFVVRSLVHPQHWTDSRVFVRDRLLAGTEDAWQDFGLPMHSAGIRLSFTGEDNREAFNVRIEPWMQEPRSLWVENTGSFGIPTPADQLPRIGQHLFATYRFVTGPLSAFIERHDQP